jgi:hypothetical protein
MPGETQPSMHDLVGVNGPARRQRLKPGLNCGPIALGKLGNVDSRANDMQPDAIVLGGGLGAVGEPRVRDHKGLVSADLLTDLLKQHDFRLVNLCRCSPFRVGDIDVRDNLATNLPVEVNLVRILGEAYSRSIRDPLGDDRL